MKSLLEVFQQHAWNIEDDVLRQLDTARCRCCLLA
jgi:hypothetical protein